MAVNDRSEVMSVASRLTPFLMHLTDRQTNRPTQPHEINIISTIPTAGRSTVECPATENAGSTLIMTSDDSDTAANRKHHVDTKSTL